MVLVLCFLPYLTLGPIAAPSQVQPWASIAAWIWVFARLARHGVSITLPQWIIIAFSVWFMLYVYQGEGFDLSVYFRRSAAFLLSVGIVLACTYASPRTIWKAICTVLPLWFAFALLRYAAPPIYFAVVTPFVPTVVVSSERGSSSLAPEATDFGFTMVFLLAIAMVVRARLLQEGGRPRRWPLLLAVFCAALSLSGTGIFGLALVAGIALANARPDRGRKSRLGRLVLLVVVGLAALFVLSTVAETGVRGVDLLAVAVTSPGELLNSTASYRIAHNLVGLHGLFDSNFIGYGAGSFLVEGYQVYLRHDVGGFLGLTGYYAQNVPATLMQSPVSFIAVILLEYGLAGLLFLVLVFTIAFRSSMPFAPLAGSLMVIAWAQSFPAAWPLFWVMLGIAMSPHFRSSEAPRKSEEGRS